MLFLAKQHFFRTLVINLLDILNVTLRVYVCLSFRVECALFANSVNGLHVCSYYIATGPQHTRSTHEHITNSQASETEGGRERGRERGDLKRKKKKQAQTERKF